MRAAFGWRSDSRAFGHDRRLLVGAVVGAVALAGCGSSPERPPKRVLEIDGGKSIYLPVRATALFEAGDLDRDGTDDLVLAAGRDHRLFTWTSRGRRVTRLRGAELRDTGAGNYPVGAGAGGIVLTGPRLSWVAARRVWPASVAPVVLDDKPFRPQGAAVKGDVMVVDAQGRAWIADTAGALRRPTVRADEAQGRWWRRCGSWRSSRSATDARTGCDVRACRGGLSRSADNESPQLIAPYGDRALAVVLRETKGGAADRQNERLVALLVERRFTVDARVLDGTTVDMASRSTPHGLAIIDRARLRVTLIDVDDGRIRVRVIPSAVGIADKDDGVAILRPNGKVVLSKLP